ncbi:hypothetical protein AAEX28_07140 [Lentisphaerota bacterium WC36G]|nr:hypothetical protein LJT99_10005 [Lentisphaerae bacterium WC36]
MSLIKSKNPNYSKDFLDTCAFIYVLKIKNHELYDFIAAEPNNLLKREQFSRLEGEFNDYFSNYDSFHRKYSFEYLFITKTVNNKSLEYESVEFIQSAIKHINELAFIDI